MNEKSKPCCTSCYGCPPVLDANVMTADELFALAYKKQQEERDRLSQEVAVEEEEKVVKTGRLKNDLYEFPDNMFNLDSYSSEYWFSEADVNVLVDKFRSLFEVIVKKGTKFVCYVYDGEESWYQDEESYVMEDMSAEWAKKHLENIEDV